MSECTCGDECVCTNPDCHCSEGEPCICGTDCECKCGCGDKTAEDTAVDQEATE